MSERWREKSADCGGSGQFGINQGPLALAAEGDLIARDLQQVQSWADKWTYFAKQQPDIARQEILATLVPLFSPPL